MQTENEKKKDINTKMQHPEKGHENQLLNQKKNKERTCNRK